MSSFPLSFLLLFCLPAVPCHSLPCCNVCFCCGKKLCIGWTGLRILQGCLQINCLSWSLCTPENQNTHKVNISRVSIVQVQCYSIAYFILHFYLAGKEFIPVHLSTPLLQPNASSPGFIFTSRHKFQAINKNESCCSLKAVELQL